MVNTLSLPHQRNSIEVRLQFAGSATMSQVTLESYNWQLGNINLKIPRYFDDVIYGRVRLYGNKYHFMWQLNGGMHRIFLNYLYHTPMWLKGNIPFNWFPMHVNHGHGQLLHTINFHAKIHFICLHEKRVIVLFNLKSRRKLFRAWSFPFPTHVQLLNIWLWMHHLH